MLLTQIDFYIDQYKENGFSSEANKLIKVRGKVLHKVRLNDADVRLLEDHNIEDLG